MSLLKGRKCGIFISIGLFGCLLYGCREGNRDLENSIMQNSEEMFLIEETKNEESDMQWEKGYDLLVDAEEEKQAETDCMEKMKLILDLYDNAEKGEAANTVLDEETVFAMQNKINELGCPVTTMIAYSNMENYECMEKFLVECKANKSSSIVVYNVCKDGGLERMKFVFDGTDMYVLNTKGIWNTDNIPLITYTSYNRIKEWSYTDKGWFCYELCVPEPPEVSEIVDGSCMLRVKPMSEDLREMSKKCVYGIGYQGNNLLTSNWDMSHMEKLDYTGLYQYLYEMEYQEKSDFEIYQDGIPKEDFENLIQKYLPVTAEQLREYAVFDKETQTYEWARLGCGNAVLSYFGTSVPEVTDIKENKDGKVTLIVDAVCDMVICEDAFITHQLTVQFKEDGSFMYLGNQILDDGMMKIPEYQYRVSVE